MRVLFWARMSVPFSPLTVERRGLGGSESALYHVARELAALGHDVTILNHCGDEAGSYDGVTYRDLRLHKSEWAAQVRAHPPDALVLFRRMLDVTVAIPARLRLFWAHDFQGVSATYPKGQLSRRLAIGWRQATGPLLHRRVDRIVVVSRFLAGVFRSLFRTPEEKLAVIPNGIDPELFAHPQVRVPFRLIYTSVPERGLAAVLRDVFPAVRARHPDAQLHVYSYQPLAPYGDLAGPGVTLHGSLPRRELARELARSEVFLHPSNFEETGSMAVLEALAAGAVPVTSSLGVLGEMIGDSQRGICVPGDPETPAFRHRYAQAVIDLLEDRQRMALLRQAGQQYVREHHTWALVARRWQDLMESLLRAPLRRA